MKKLLKATNEGKIQLGENELSVAVLEDGTRIITQSAVFKSFGRTKRGRTKEDVRVPNMPAFIDANNLQPYINQDLKTVLKPIEYTAKNGSDTTGYDANILPLMCKMYLDARQAKVLKTQQIPLARASEILLIGLSKIGITALVDEATGYQYEREKDALQIILKAYINKELLKWQKMFPDQFYFEIFRLNGWSYTVSGIKKRPGVIGTWTKELIYNQLPKGVLQELIDKTPKSKEGNYTARFFQSLTPDIGHPALTAQIYKVIGIMQISNTWNEFKSNFNRMVDRANGQTELDFEKIEKQLEEIEVKEHVELSEFNQLLKKGIGFNPKKIPKEDNQQALEL